jgi:hypothetical protein
VQFLQEDDAMPTHEVQNQVPPLVGYNLFTTDRALVAALDREGGGWAEDQACRLGEILGGEEAIQWGFDANNNPPILHTHDGASRAMEPTWPVPRFPCSQARMKRVIAAPFP